MGAHFLIFSAGYGLGELGTAVSTAMRIRPHRITVWLIILILGAILTTTQSKTVITCGRALLGMLILTDTPTARARSMLQASL